MLGPLGLSLGSGLLAGCVVLLEEGDEVVDALLVLQPGIDHLGARDLGLRVLDVLAEGGLVPGDAGVLVGRGVAVPLDGARLAPEQAVEDRADRVLGGLADLVAGPAL